MTPAALLRAVGRVVRWRDRCSLPIRPRPARRASEPPTHCVRSRLRLHLERARALGRAVPEAGKVIQHPRCVNCHPAGDGPLQTDAVRPHQPLVVRGADGHGAPGMQCDTCHHDANFDPARVPGHPKWHLAPLSMAWEGKSLGQICEQIKDPARNGGKDLAALRITWRRIRSSAGW